MNSMTVLTEGKMQMETQTLIWFQMQLMQELDFLITLVMEIKIRVLQAIIIARTSTTPLTMGSTHLLYQ